MVVTSEGIHVIESDLIEHLRHQVHWLVAPVTWSSAMSIYPMIHMTYI
jgi:hypothetical protein